MIKPSLSRFYIYARRLYKLKAHVKPEMEWSEWRASLVMKMTTYGLRPQLLLIFHYLFLFKQNSVYEYDQPSNKSRCQLPLSFSVISLNEMCGGDSCIYQNNKKKKKKKRENLTL